MRSLLLILTFVFFTTLSYSQAYFLNQSEDFIRGELRNEYVVKEIFKDLSNEIPGKKTPILVVSFGGKMAVKDGNFKSVYYFEDNKCIMIKELYFNDDDYLDRIVNRFNKNTELKIMSKVGSNNWKNVFTKIEYALGVDKEIFFLLYGY